jgi:hypothetical protein
MPELWNSLVVAQWLELESEKMHLSVKMIYQSIEIITSVRKLDLVVEFLVVDLEPSDPALSKVGFTQLHY